MIKRRISEAKPGHERDGRVGRLVVRLFVLAAMLALVFGLALAYPLFMRGRAWLDVSFRHPWFLLLLLLVPLVLWRGTFGEDSRLPRLRLGTLQVLDAGPRGLRTLFRDLPGVLRTAVVAMIAVALAQPISMMRPETTDELGIDIVLVLDLSGSMRAVMDGPTSDMPTRTSHKGIRPTRLDIAKRVMQDFISLRKTDRIGVVVFSTSAYVLSPPTLDYQLLDTLVGKMSLDLIDGSSTSIGDALGVAVARLRRSDARSKAVVLFTDGDSNSGAIAPEYAAHLATVIGCRVYTIQIGNGDDVDVQDGLDLFGNPRYVRAKFPVNPELLQQIAKTTGGEAFVATDAKGLRESMHDVLNALEKTKFEANQASFEDLFVLFLLPGVLLVALDALVRAWLLRRFP